MKILVFATAFPPNVVGGGEYSAFNLSRLLAERGHNVTVLTMEESNEPEVRNQLIPHGFHIYRLHFPRPYTFFGHLKAKKWQKPLWHLQDYLDPRNRKIIRQVLKEVAPDHINIHTFSGFGFNALPEIAASGASTTYFLHDLNLACLKGTMFKGGQECAKQCGACHITSNLKNHWLEKLPKLGFISPSQSNLETLKRFVPAIANRPSMANRNVPDALPTGLIPHQASATIRLLYAGRLHPTKGVDVMLKALAPLASTYKFHLTLLGRGEMEDSLKQTYGNAPWLTFGGFVGQEEVTQAVASADLLCTPSIWAEPYGRVTAQALQLGTPVIGSNRGGTLELVRHEETGLIVEAGNIKAWQEAFERIFKNPNVLQEWRENTKNHAHEFSPSTIAEKYEHFVQHLQGLHA